MQFQLTKEFLEELHDAVAAADEHFLLDRIADLHPADIAEIFEDFSVEEAQFFYKLLDEEVAADVLMELDEEARERFLASFSPVEIAERFIDNLDSDDAADVIQELPEDIKEEVIASIEDVEQASDIIDLLAYQEGMAGALMAKELIRVNENWTVRESMKEMRRQAEQLDYVYTVYVVDNNERLLGTLSLKKMLLTPSSTKVKNIYKPEVKWVKTTGSKEEVANLMKKYDLVVLPVVDELHRLQGRITIDDVVDVMQEEADKDYQMASGISQNIESTDTVWVLTRARLPWLLIGLLGGVLGAAVIGRYEEQLGLHPEMAFFIPLIAAMGGNVGVQSSAIVVQGLANNTLGMGGWWQKFSKELSVAVVNGFICSLLIFGYNIFFTEPSTLAYTVSLALFAVILFAALFGTFVPLMLNRYKIDPALATGPFITTVNDVLGLFIYFAIGHILYAA